MSSTNLRRGMAIVTAGLLLHAHIHAQASASSPAASAQEEPASAARDLFVVVGKSVVVQTPVTIERIVVTDPAIAEALAVSPREVVVHGRGAGETSLIIWLQGGNRLLFDLKVRPNLTKLREAIEVTKGELADELPGQDIQLRFENNTTFLTGTAKDTVSAARAEKIAETLGAKVVDLLDVKTPAEEAQILLKVRFADVDRAVATDLGVNLFSTGALNTIGQTTTGQYASGLVKPPTGGTAGQFTLSDALNIFLFRPDLNFGATIKALQAQRLLEILAEPNVLAINGKTASFLAGGEFPYPTLQGGGGGLGAVTISFREFGVRINFLPMITPRGTIRLQVTPEVSTLDYANGLTFQGFTIPGLATRRVQTELELESGQSFIIGGLLDNRVTQTLEKIPGLGDIPILGKLFQTKSVTKNNTELLVLVTPEIVRPIPKEQAPPQITMPEPFMKDAPTEVPRTPGMDVTGPVPVKPAKATIPLETLMELEKAMKAPPASTPGPIEFVPAQLVPVRSPQQAAPSAAPAPTAAPPPAASTGANK